MGRAILSGRGGWLGVWAAVLFGLMATGTVAPASAQASGEVRERLQEAAALERSGSTDRALRVLRDLLERAPAEPRAILAAERIYRRQGRLEELLPLLDRAVDAEPGAGVLRHTQLRVLAELGRVDRLRTAGEDWIGSAAAQESVYREYASALSRVGEYAEAERVLQRGRQALGRSDALAPDLADLYIRTGRWAEATVEWGRLVGAEPQLGWELINLKLESLDGELAPLADEMIRRFGTSEDPAERKLAAIAAVYAGRDEEARRLATELLERLPDRERQTLAARFAQIAARRSHPDLVAWAYRQLLREMADDSARSRLAREIVQHDLSAGDTASAVEILEGVLERAREGSEAHRWASGRVIELEAVRNPAAAERALRRHGERYPGDPEAARLALAVARSNLRAGRLDAAEAVIDRIELDDRETRVAARFALLRAYLALYRGRHDESKAQLEFAASALDGSDRGEAIRLLGIMKSANTAEAMAVAAAHRAWLRGEPLDGLEELDDRLDRASRSDARPAIWLWAGEVALEAGALERGERMLRSIHERYPDSGEAPAALLTLAESLARSDRAPQAVPLLEELIVSYPESALTPVARRRLAELREEVPRS